MASININSVTQELEQLNKKVLRLFATKNTSEILGEIVELVSEKFKTEIDDTFSNQLETLLTPTEEINLFKAWLIAKVISCSPVDWVVSGNEKYFRFINGEKDNAPPNLIASADNFCLHNHPGSSGATQFSKGDLFAMAHASRSVKTDFPYWELVTTNRENIQVAGIRVLQAISDSMIENFIDAGGTTTDWFINSSKLNKKFEGYMQIFSWFHLDIDF